MGFLDSLQSSVNRGMAATGRATSTMKLKAQMSEALKRRQALAAQLGASLYDVTKDDANLRAGREALYDGIAACDAERAQCQAEIERLEAESAAATAANSYYVCPFCGSHVVTTDLFCSGCGKPMAEITAALSAQQQAPAAPVAPVSGAAACPQCGAPVNAGDVFCMSCGYNLAAAPAPAAVAASDPEPAYQQSFQEPEESGERLCPNEIPTPSIPKTGSSAGSGSTAGSWKRGRTRPFPPWNG